MSHLPCFSRTRKALGSLTKLLLCCKCDTYMNAPITLAGCNHVFCQNCLKSCDKCPICSVPFWVQDQKVNRRLSSVSYICSQLRQHINDGGTSFETSNGRNLDALDSGNDLVLQTRQTKCGIQNSLRKRQFDKENNTRKTIDRKQLKKAKLRHSIDSIPKKTTAKSSSRRSTLSTCFPKDIEKNSKGETKLHVAAIQGNIDAVSKLLQNPVNLNEKDNAGWTALHEACNRDHTEIVRMLLDNGAYIDIPGYENETPLMDAVMNNRLNTVRLLLERGANVSLRKLDGRTAFSFAKADEMKSLLTHYNHACNENSEIDPSVLLTTANNIKISYSSSVDSSKVKRLANLLHAKSSNRHCLGCSHFLVAHNESLKTARTLKFLQAVASGSWVITENWLDECLKLCCKVSELEFQIKGSYNDHRLGGPLRSSLAKLKCLPRLFDGCHFFLYGRFSSPSPTKTELSELIKVSGGSVLSREPKPHSDCVQACQKVPYHAKPDTDQYFFTYYIIYDSSQQQQPRLVRQGKVCAVTVNWLLDCISQFELCKIV
ncbi:BRCA1-associated RING domain protein 1-like [Clavelina lepadiformis]|uniref:BRCA1-associated RING domain protein 1-like n=1 Tax=Clavelina lepadiformis TaxID=159417 RepID=UPI00404292AB